MVPSTPKSGVVSRRRFALTAVPMLVVLMLLSNPEEYGRHLRRLAQLCVHNIYAGSVTAALDIPANPEVDVGTEVPSYIAICHEWIRRGAEGNLEATHTIEDDTPCLDWTAPHYRIMEVFSSGILDRANDLSRYRHDCYRTRSWDEAETGMDRTTVQQMLAIARVDPDELVSDQDMRDQCKVCLMYYDPDLEADRLNAYSSHHCFGFPESWDGATVSGAVAGPGQRGDIISIPSSPVAPNVVPLSTIVQSVRTRLGYVGKIFSNVTDAPPEEPTSGVVVYLDASSTGIAKEIYPLYFPATVTTISVIASPLCATAQLPTGQKCSAYAQELVDYFTTLYPGLTNTGFKGEAGIKFQMPASTAGAYSRMILAKKLICPPKTPTCLFAGLAKLSDSSFDTSATILESSDWGSATEFYTYMGTQGVATVEKLPDSDIPSDVAKPSSNPQLYTSSGAAAAPEFMMVNNELDAEGYPVGASPRKLAAMSRTAAAAMSDADVLAATNLPSNTANPNVFSPEVEEDVDPSYAASRRSIKKPININYSVEGTDLKATDEMGVDTDLGFATRELTDAIFADQAEKRKLSQQRIHAFVSAAKKVQYEEVTNGNPLPSMEMEVYCPELATDGETFIQFDSGYAIDKMLEPGTKRTDEYAWNGFHNGRTDPVARRRLSQVNEVKIKVSAEEAKFATPEDLKTLCDKNKDKIMAASKVARQERSRM